MRNINSGGGKKITAKQRRRAARSRKNKRLKRRNKRRTITIRDGPVGYPRGTFSRRRSTTRSTPWPPPRAARS